MKISIKDTLVVCLSDMHSAGTTALFPPMLWQFQHGNHTPTKKQKAIWRHFDFCANLIAENRKGKRLIIVHDGDAIDGVHHGSHQIATRNKNEQIEVHTWLMDHFLRTAGFDKQKGDQLYYVTGTETHVNDNENIIGKDLDAEKDGDLYSFDFLDITVNGRKLWLNHRGPSPGRGANKGNGMRNYLRNLYFDCLNETITPPDMVIAGHVHDPFYDNYNQWVGDRVNTVHGIILPSWQTKTRFAYGIAPTSRNKIGLVYFTVKAEGDIITPKFSLMKDKRKSIRI